MAQGEVPHVTRVVGTDEFILAWDRLAIVVKGHFDARHQASVDAILQCAEIACRQAYLDGILERTGNK